MVYSDEWEPDDEHGDDDSKPHSCQARCKRATDKALLVVTEDARERWVPRSVVSEDSEVYDAGHDGELVIAGWFADKEGWR